MIFQSKGCLYLCAHLAFELKTSEPNIYILKLKLKEKEEENGSLNASRVTVPLLSIHIFTSVHKSIKHSLCKYLPCVWGWKKQAGLLNRCAAQFFFPLLWPRPKTMQHCATVKGECDRSLQAVIHMSSTRPEVKLHFGLSLNSDGWLTAVSLGGP